MKIIFYFNLKFVYGQRDLAKKYTFTVDSPRSLLVCSSARVIKGQYLGNI